jgi:hypothetical protein
MPLIRATILALAVPALLALACSDSPPPPAGGDGGPADVVSGSGGTTGGLPGVPSGTGGSGPASTGGTSTPGPSGTGGQGVPPSFPLPDGGLPGLDGGLPGLIDAGVVSYCPAAPAGKTCGAAGTAPACLIENSQPQQGCLCIVQRWVCGGADGGAPGLDGGLPIGQPPTACPANAAGMTCPSLAAVCTSGMAGCVCLPGAGGGLAWLCR